MLVTGYLLCIRKYQEYHKIYFLSLTIMEIGYYFLHFMYGDIEVQLFEVPFLLFSTQTQLCSGLALAKLLGCSGDHIWFWGLNPV